MAGKGYRIEITCEGKEDILMSTENDTDQNIVNHLSFSKKTLEHLKTQANTLHLEFEIKGIINESSKGVLKSVAEWAMDEKKETLYRKVEILVNNDDSGFTDTSKTYRRYSFEKMYVVDYEEIFVKDGNEDDGEYRLIISQKAERAQRDVTDH